MAMFKVLKYLKDEEFKALLQGAERAAFQPGEALIRQGEEHTNLFIVVQGEVKITRAHDDFVLEISRHGPGEIFGDMSFLEGLPANVNVVAGDAEVLAVVISHAYIERHAQEDPGFGARFYQSLAAILSKRLRDTTEKVETSQEPETVWGSV